MKKSILKEKSFEFAKVIYAISLCLREQSEYVLSRQILRSGTAIGALIREAEFAQSKKDFSNKMSVALKEANETLYWLELISDLQLISRKVFESSFISCKELVAMLVSSVKTSKQNIG